MSDAPGTETLSNRAPRDRDNRVFLRLSWDQWCVFQAMRGDSPSPRIAYAEGVLELMSPSIFHEAFKKRIAALLEAWAGETKTAMSGYGSWTIESPLSERAIEPDECYVIGRRKPGDFPDLAIEIIWTSGGLARLAIYEVIGVPEVWIWQRGALRVYVLVDGHYEERERSALLPTLDLAALVRFTAEEDVQTDVVERWRTFLRYSSKV